VFLQGTYFNREWIMKVKFELVGSTPLLMKQCSVDESDRLEAWRKDPANKGQSKAGDDRTPAWTWQTCLYSDGSKVVMPADNLMACLRKAGAQMILKGKKTFKEASQSGILIPEEFMTFKCRGEEISMSEILALRDLTYQEQAERVQKLGFRLFCKRATIGQAKHIRVRPRFEVWSVEGTLNVMSADITKEVLKTMFDIAGTVGLGDWRPGGKTPGAYGMFTVRLS